MDGEEPSFHVMILWAQSGTVSLQSPGQERYTGVGTEGSSQPVCFSLHFREKETEAQRGEVSVLGHTGIGGQPSP